MELHAQQTCNERFNTVMAHYEQSTLSMNAKVPELPIKELPDIAHKPICHLR